MYYVSKRMEIAGAHKLNLSYSSPCENLHGHNWIITVYCMSDKLNPDGMIADFALIKKAIHGVLDHKNLNDVVDFNPTAENIAKWVCDTVSKLCFFGTCYRADVQESEGNVATYQIDEVDEW